MGPGNRPLDLEWLEDFLALAHHLRIPEKVARRRIEELPARLVAAMDAIPSPWVAPGQAGALREHVHGMAGRLSSLAD